MRYPLCYTAVFLLSGPAIKYKTNYQRARVYINVGIYKGYKARASRWIRIVKFGPINSGKSFNLNRTLTLARGGFGAWSAGGWRSNGWRVIAGLLLKYSETRGNRATATAFYHRARPVKTVKHTTDAPLFRPEKHLFYIIRDSREEISLSLSPSHFFSFTRTHTSIYPFGLCVQFYQVALPDYDGRCTTWIVIDNDFYPFRFDAPPYTGHRGGFTRPCSRFARVCTTVEWLLEWHGRVIEISMAKRCWRGRVARANRSDFWTSVVACEFESERRLNRFEIQHSTGQLVSNERNFPPKKKKKLFLKKKIEMSIEENCD